METVLEHFSTEGEVNPMKLGALVKINHGQYVHRPLAPFIQGANQTMRIPICRRLAPKNGCLAAQIVCIVAECMLYLDMMMAEVPHHDNLGGYRADKHRSVQDTLRIMTSYRIVTPVKYARCCRCKALKLRYFM